MALWIGSATVMLIFMVHNIAAMMTDAYNQAPAVIYALFIAIIAVGALIHRNLVNKHNLNHIQYISALEKTGNLKQQGIAAGWMVEKELYKKI